jgi:hypothetical protein
MPLAGDDPAPNLVSKFSRSLRAAWPTRTAPGAGLSAFRCINPEQPNFDTADTQTVAINDVSKSRNFHRIGLWQVTDDSEHSQHDSRKNEEIQRSITPRKS